jgi:hypothetical protein
MGTKPSLFRLYTLCVDPIGLQCQSLLRETALAQEGRKVPRALRSKVLQLG